MREKRGVIKAGHGFPEVPPISDRCLPVTSCIQQLIKPALLYSEQVTGGQPEPSFLSLFCIKQRCPKPPQWTEVWLNITESFKTEVCIIVGSGSDDKKMGADLRKDAGSVLEQRLLLKKSAGFVGTETRALTTGEKVKRGFPHFCFLL
jgi:hypothetical protein